LCKGYGKPSSETVSAFWSGLTLSVAFKAIAACLSKIRSIKRNRREKFFADKLFAFHPVHGMVTIAAGVMQFAKYHDAGRLAAKPGAAAMPALCE
jgi:formate hydrogenlyase subunit 3/multisubunit Na+/H+ antiporter MnhD subunit